MTGFGIPPRVILEVMVKHLTESVGHYRRQDLASREVALSGDGHLATALRLARAALASGDASKIGDAASICPTYERQGLAMKNQGLAMKKEHLEAAAAMARDKLTAKNRVAGKGRGAKQSEDMSRLFKPYQTQYDELRLRSPPLAPAKARNVVKSKMIKDKFTVPGRDIFPADSTIRKYLKDPPRK